MKFRRVQKSVKHQNNDALEESHHNDNFECINSTMHVTLRKGNARLETTLLVAKRHQNTSSHSINKGNNTHTSQKIKSNEKAAKGMKSKTYPEKL